MFFVVLLLLNVQFSFQQDCWTLYNNSQTYGGAAQDRATSLLSCKTICQTTYGCRAVEWAPSSFSTKCFTFSSAELPTYLNSRPGIEHYISSSTCGCVWQPYIGMQSFGGTPETLVNTLQQCQERCVYSWNCKAIEWIDNAPTKCFTFSSDALPTTTNSAITHYIWQCSTGQSVTPVLTGCSWSPTPDVNTPGGTVQPNAKSPEDCKSACLVTNSCRFGFDWNPLSPIGQQCWISNSASINGNPGITHYTYNCTGSASVSWNIINGYNSPGGIMQPTALSISDCKSLCLSTNYCFYGFDWNRNAPIGQRCWLSTQSNRTVYADVDHYIATFGSTGVPDTVCTWYSFPNSNSPNGLPQQNITTVGDCQRGCRANSSCPGIDWDEKGPVKCWFSQNLIVSINSYPGVTHYNYTCQGVTSTTTTIASSGSTMLGANCDYVLYNNLTQSAGGGLARSYTTEVDCKNQCTVQASCKAFEWRINSNPACIFYTTDAVPTMPWGPTKYYIFRKCS